MSKADGWMKESEGEWRHVSTDFDARITKVTGNSSWPYMWDVYPLPRNDHIVDGRWRPVGSGSEAKLAGAKDKAVASMKKARGQS